MKEGNLLIRQEVDHSLGEWRNEEKLALELQQITGELRFNRSIELILFGQRIHNSKTSEILNAHRLAQQISPKKYTVETSLVVAQAIFRVEKLAPCKIDIGRLGIEWLEEKYDYNNPDEFVHFKLKSFISVDPKNQKARDVVLYGFGRIGRLAARELVNQTGKGEQLRLKAIVVRPKLKDPYEEASKRAALLAHDSVHGSFPGFIDVKDNGKEIVINGNKIQMIYANSPAEIDYTEYGIHNALLIDNTGVWRSRKGLENHLRPGIDKVLLTAPGKGDVPNIVYKANEEDVSLEDNKIFSAASCTTNAIVPVIDVIMETHGIDKGHIETIHSYTNDQNLIDNFHKKQRRGKGAATNIVITSTGAATAVTKVFPELKGKLTGNAIRVPTPNVSIAILSLTLNGSTNSKELNAILKKASFSPKYKEQILYSSSTEYVSSNAIGMNTTSVVDAPSTKVSEDGKNATVYLWYDNEYGYTCQVIRLAKHLMSVRRFIY